MEVLYKYFKNYKTKLLVFYIWGFKTEIQKGKTLDILQTQEITKQNKKRIEKAEDIENNMLSHRKKANHDLTNKIKPQERDGKVEISTKDACFDCDASTQTATRQKAVCVIMWKGKNAGSK